MTTVLTEYLEVSTRGNDQVLDITEQVRTCAEKVGVSDGIVTLFVVGSTAGLTTTEFEPGLANHDLAAMFEKLAPRDARYEHEETWHDDNGHSHVRASLLGPSLTIPIVGGQLTLGTWQQIILIDFDTRSRTRRIVVQIMS